MFPQNDWGLNPARTTYSSKWLNLVVLHVDYEAWGGSELQFDGALSPRPLLLPVITLRRSGCHTSQDSEQACFYSQDKWAKRRRLTIFMTSSQSRRSTYGTRAFKCLFTANVLLFTPLTGDRRGDLWHGYVWKQCPSLPRLLLLSLHMWDKDMLKSRDKWGRWNKTPEAPCWVGTEEQADMITTTAYIYLTVNTAHNV